jgi:ribosome-interacting GTPase 1
MPANLTPEYKTAEAAFRRARDPEERLEHLRVMLRTIPKHKGTEHLRAEIKTRIKDLNEQLKGSGATAVRGGPPTYIHPDGAAQLALVGGPNSGKSALHAALTGSHAAAGPYPFTTQFPQPGMLEYGEVLLQLVDLPAVSPEHPIPWLGNALQSADGVLLVVDLSEPGCVDRVLAVRRVLADRKVYLRGSWDADDLAPMTEDEPFAVYLPAAIVITKCDLLDDVAEELEAFRELAAIDYPALVVSSATGEGLDDIGPWLFDHLGIVRVYTKVPGKAADYTRPFAVRRGQTVSDVARLVHRDIAASLKYARVWGEESFDGQQVGRDHVVADGDVIELHT